MDPVELVKVKVEPPKLPPAAAQAVELVKAQRQEAGAAASMAQPASAAPSEAEAQASMVPPLPQSGDTSSYGVWIAIAAGVLLLALVGVAIRLWLKRRPSPAAKAPPTPPESNPMHAWDTFLAGLPWELQRVWADFQPVILLADEGAERDRLVRDLTGNPTRQKSNDNPVSYENKALGVYLGTNALILAPAGELLLGSKPGANRHWRQVVTRICRVRSPRVVVSLSQTLLDGGGEQKLAQEAGRLRAHVDAIAAIRGADVEVSVVIPQAAHPGKIHRDSPPTDALFALIRGLLANQCGVRRSFELTEATFAGNERERHDAGAHWARSRLDDYRKDWVRLLAQPGQDADATLGLVHLFEQLDTLASNLGVVLSELLPQRKAAQDTSDEGVGELVWLPSAGEALEGEVRAFVAAASDSDKRWYPSTLLKHRLIAATLAAGLSLLAYGKFSVDLKSWDIAMTAALRYSPPGEGHEIAVVRSYFFGAGAQWSFFNRDLPGDCVVSKTRELLHQQIAKEARTASPEHLLQLVSLLLTSEPKDCDMDQSPEFKKYEELAKIILENVEEWQHLTKLHAEEIISYLKLACPKEHAPREIVEFEQCAHSESCQSQWQAVPSADALIDAMEALSGGCELDAKERQNAEQLGHMAYELNEVGRLHGSAYRSLEVIRGIGTETMTALYRLFHPYEDRLRRINQLDVEDGDLQLLTSDVRPFFGEKVVRLDTLSELNDRLADLVAGRPPSDADAIVRLHLGNVPHQVDRARMWSSLMVFSSHGAFDEFERTADIAFPGGPFFANSRVADQPTSFVRTPSGIGVTAKTQVPLRYTRAAYEQNVMKDMERLLNLQQAITCTDEDKSPPLTHPPAVEFNEFVRQALTTYDVAYAEQWRRVYESFRVSATSRGPFERALEILSGPSSPQLSLMREVVSNTALPVDAESPFSDSMASTRASFASLEAALDPKVFGDYQALLRELLAAVQAIPGPSMVCSAPDEPIKDAATAVEAFASGLSNFAKMQLSGTVDPAVDLRSRLDAWFKDAGLPASLQEPFLQPFKSSASLGVSELRFQWLQCWLKSRKAALRSELLNRFPFKHEAQELAEPDAIVRWLHPMEGRLAIEIDPVIAALRGCEACEFVEGEGDDPLLSRKARALFFDDKGEPRAIEYQVSPERMSATLLAAHLSQGECQVSFRNTAVQPKRCSFEWSAQQSLDVTLSAPWGRFRSSTDSSHWRVLTAFRDGALSSGQVNVGLVGAGLEACAEECETTNLDLRVHQDITQSTEATALWRRDHDGVDRAQAELDATRARVDTAETRLKALRDGNGGREPSERDRSEAIARARAELDRARVDADAARSRLEQAEAAARDKRQVVSRARATARQQAEEGSSEWVPAYVQAFRVGCETCGAELVDDYLNKYANEFEARRATLAQDRQLGCRDECQALMVSYDTCVGPAERCRSTFAELLQ